jgi:hypothetical protein
MWSTGLDTPNSFKKKGSHFAAATRGQSYLLQGYRHKLRGSSGASLRKTLSRYDRGGSRAGPRHCFTNSRQLSCRYAQDTRRSRLSCFSLVRNSGFGDHYYSLCALALDERGAERKLGIAPCLRILGHPVGAGTSAGNATDRDRCSGADRGLPRRNSPHAEPAATRVAYPGPTVGRPTEACRGRREDARTVATGPTPPRPGVLAPPPVLRAPATSARADPTGGRAASDPGRGSSARRSDARPRSGGSSSRWSPSRRSPARS